MLVTFSSFVMIIAFAISANLPATDGSRLETIPLVLVGVAYSIYCAAIWGSIPYAVPAQSVGTAFGICTAIQNIGLVIAPTLVGWIKTHTT
jgi:nitrate/nitrite transporter NarK